MIETARTHMGINGRQKIKNKTRLPVRFINDEGTTVISVAIDDHPSALILPTMRMPGGMLGLPLSSSEPPSVGVGIIPMTPDFQSRAAAFSPRSINLTRGIDALACYRLFAKIGHAFLVGKYGLDGFVPCVLHIVRAMPAIYADHWIGSLPIPEPEKDVLHEVGLTDPINVGDWEFLVVRIRLFAFIAGTPTYYVIAGRRQTVNKRSL